jgi:hypothetical protein
MKLMKLIKKEKNYAVFFFFGFFFKKRFCYEVTNSVCEAKKEKMVQYLLLSQILDGTFIRMSESWRHHERR